MRTAAGRLCTQDSGLRTQDSKDLIRFHLDWADALSYRARGGRSEEHTSELQSQSKIVCRLLLEKKTIPIGHQCPLCPNLPGCLTRIPQVLQVIFVTQGIHRLPKAMMEVDAKLPLRS